MQHIRKFPFKTACRKPQAPRGLPQSFESKLFAHVLCVDMHLVSKEKFHAGRHQATAALHVPMSRCKAWVWKVKVHFSTHDVIPLLNYCLCDICSTHLDPLNMSACLTTLSSLVPLTAPANNQHTDFWLERVDVRDDMRIQAKEAGASTADLFRRHTVSAQDTRRFPVPLLVKVVCVQHCTAAALCLQVLYEETTLILGWRGFHNWCMFIYTYS